MKRFSNRINLKCKVYFFKYRIKGNTHYRDVTVCYITSDINQAIGISVLNPTDIADHFTGKRIAYRQAAKNLKKVTRTPIVFSGCTKRLKEILLTDAKTHILVLANKFGF